MRVGIVLPQQRIGADVGVLRDFALAAEALGFSHIVAYDHVLGAEHARRDPSLVGPYTEEDAFHEVLTLFAWWAAVTERIELVAGVLVLPQRQTALVAKQAVQLDLLSDGRFRLGVGVGWNYVEYESLGMDFHNRGRRVEEQVEVLRRLWTEPVVDVAERFHRIDRAGLRPLPPHPIPVWFGGYSDAALRRCARLGDGFIWGRRSSAATAGIDRVRALAADLGRDPATLGFEAILGEPEQWTHDLERWEGAGGTHVAVEPWGDGAGLIDGLHRCHEILRSHLDVG
jgi:probable F420-dependent oxidoreductase